MHILSDTLCQMICLLLTTTLAILSVINKTKIDTRFKYLQKIGLIDIFIYMSNILYAILLYYSVSDDMLFHISTFYYICCVLSTAYTYIYILTLIPSCYQDIKKIESFVILLFLPLIVCYIYNYTDFIIFNIINGKLIKYEFGFITYLPSFIILILTFFTMSIIKRNKVSSNIKRNIYIFYPFTIFIVALQLYDPTTQITDFAFAYNLLMFYMLFHSKPIEVITGGVENETLYNEIKLLNSSNSDFYVMSVTIANYENLNKQCNKNFIENQIVDILKSIEKCLSKKVKFYKLSDDTIICISKTSKNEISTCVNNILTKYSNKILYFEKLSVKLHIKTTILKYPCGIIDKKTFDNIQNLGLKKCEVDNFYYYNISDINKIKEENNLLMSLSEIIINPEEAENAIKIYYQPIRDNKNNKFIIMEALSRIYIEDKMIYPDKFIPLIERYGYMHRFSCIVLTKVCKFIKELENKDINIEGISVNFSVDELQDKNFVKNIIDITNKYKVDSHKIHIELTETENTDDYKIMKSKMEELISYGFKFYLDDFGSGYSNLNRIITLPFSVIKFDKELVTNATKNKNSYDIVYSFSNLLKSKKYKLLFEGIENETYVTLVDKIKVDFSQGYLYSKPIPEDEIIKFLEKNNN